MAGAGELGVVQARVVLKCEELEPTLSFFCERLGFRVDGINPADAPTTVILSGHGLLLELRVAEAAEPVTIRLLCDSPESLAEGGQCLTAPNGTRIELADANPSITVPPMKSAFSLSRLDGASWGTGRAGMRYRDLIPDRQGGRFIASHIQVPEGGPIPDYVHYHKIRFQMIYCYKGWCRLVYEDQGPPFVMEAGDCVLQPPQIRHRVLESSPGFEVVELGCPAIHETFADHDLALPTSTVAPDRRFGDQRYVLHRSASATWAPFRLEGFECRDTGIADATNGLASVRVARPSDNTDALTLAQGVRWRHEAELVFGFVLSGSVRLTRDREGFQLGEGDAVVLPSGIDYRFSDASSELEFLEITLPGTIETTQSDN